MPNSKTQPQIPVTHAHAAILDALGHAARKV